MATPHKDIPAADASAEPFRLAPRAFVARHFAPKPSSTTAPPATQATPQRPRPPAPHGIGVGAIVFDRSFPSPSSSSSSSSDAPQPPPPRVLLVQRAPHDSMPLKWEIPGGGSDDDDPSVLYACARELQEESGLRATRVGPLAKFPLSSSAGRRTVAAATPTATATTPGDETAMNDDGPADEEPAWGERMGGTFFFSRSGKLVCKFVFVVDVERADDGAVVVDDVRLDPNEHVAHVWATEAEVRSRTVDVRANSSAGLVRADGTRAEDGEVELAFASRDEWKVVLDAFQLWRAFEK
ncbi:8-oxo-dGTP diphosphatase [Microdochium nivale]|nr:8-oxo-dGTP diphosphatase [Microdochium nivale]